jgi:hypothetical protein
MTAQPEPVVPGAPPNLLLSGIVGSVAYGLDTENSDIDRFGIFAAPTETLIGLIKRRGPQSVRPEGADACYHEAGHFAELALKANPAVTELMWLPPNRLEICTPLGEALIGIRLAFLSRKYVRSSYLRYITRQFRKLETRGDNGTFSSDVKDRVAKHARHLYRLHVQAIVLWQTGHLTVRLPYGDAVLCRAFGDEVAAGNLTAGRRIIAQAEHVLSTSGTPLPEHPDEDFVEAWLQDVRRAYYMTGAAG